MESEHVAHHRTNVSTQKKISRTIPMGVCVCAALCAAITRAQNRLRRLSRVLADSFVFQLCFVFVTNYLVQ